MQKTIGPHIQEPITKQDLLDGLKPKQMIPHNPSNLYLLAKNIQLILLNHPLPAHKQQVFLKRKLHRRIEFQWN